MKDPKLGISDKYITFFFSISKKLTKTNKLLITSEVKTMRYVCKPIYSLERTELNTICIRQDTTKLSLS